eukprot:gnl/MRDRNA2_/MRDRNA2_121537_c0_seq1.p1 gnl/MRDRNA2_/MRDRNA2_121537_c0~~gnl/MRDRNA2_/MRDRNA2_121537_c0_seq1.p1  ORF type:complete len:812 (-),score=105.91 gnl/MRDRNA2_/MRDRNA2_121537_c0_seq1:110-2545(-)
MDALLNTRLFSVSLTPTGRTRLKRLCLICCVVSGCMILFGVDDAREHEGPVVHRSLFEGLFPWFFGPEYDEQAAIVAEAAAQPYNQHAPVAEILKALWHGEAAAFHPNGNSTGPVPPPSEVLLAVSREIRDATVGTFVGETALLHAVNLCLELCSTTPTIAVYSSPRDIGQLAYMVGTQHPTASVLTFHPSEEELSSHCRLLRSYHSPRGLRLKGVLAAGTWCGMDLERFAATPSIVDVQLVIGTVLGGDLLEEGALHALLSLARWTLISLPLLLKHNDSDPSTSSRDLLLRSLWFENDNIVIDAEVASLGVVRVPASSDVQALFLVRARRVERRTFADWHHLDNARRMIRFTDENNAELVSSKGDVEAEPSGIPLETLVSLGLPMYERVRLLGLALITLEVSDISGWLVCCGGLLRQTWPGGDSFVAGSAGAVSQLACTFGLGSEIGEMVEATCGRPCQICEGTPLAADGTKDDNCIACGQCVSQGVATQIPDSAAPKQGGSTAGQVGTAILIELEGFAGPFADDIPGAGDILNIQVQGLTHCATLCKEIPRCRSFEFSPTAAASAPIRNCQLASSINRAGVPYSDFGLYLKKGGATSMGVVDTRLTIVFSKESASEDGSLSTMADHGHSFGATGGGGHQLGWLCNDVPMDVGSKYFSPDEGFRFDVGGFCPSGAVWRIAVPPGLYEVKVFVPGRGNVTGCRAQTAPLRVQPSLVNTPASDHTSWFAAGAVEVASGPLQIRCDPQNAARLVKAVIRRTWRLCADQTSGMSWLPSVGSIAALQLKINQSKALDVLSAAGGSPGASETIVRS